MTPIKDSGGVVAFLENYSPDVHLRERSADRSLKTARSVRLLPTGFRPATQPRSWGIRLSLPAGFFFVRPRFAPVIAGRVSPGRAAQ